jgi:hypothetical protein
VKHRLGFESLEPRLPLAADFVISEFLADNGGSHLDNYGVQSDWIEIHNAGDAPGSLAGYYLTDDDDELTRWQFPDVSIAAGGYLLVYASGQDDRDPLQPLHTNFSLAKEEEYLALVAPDGQTLVDSFGPQYPPQRTDISYGFGQVFEDVPYVAPRADAQILVPTSNAVDAVWNQPGYVPDAAWTNGAAGFGYEPKFNGFLVRTYRGYVATSSVIGTSLDTIQEALEVIGNPSAYTSVAGGNYATINLANGGWTGTYSGDSSFPGLTSISADHFATEAHARVTIPSAGAWTFGVNSDEGFLLQIGDEFEASRSGTGSATQLTTFTFAAAGVYDLHLYHFERIGAAGIELFAAPGTHVAWNSAAFDLVGNVAAGGLAVQSDVVVASGATIPDFLGTNLRGEMFGQAPSFYARIPFNVADPSIYEQLRLRIKYDDAFVAYLNGQEIARRNFNGTPAWNSTAASPRTGAEIFTDVEIDVTAYLNALLPGANALAIHGMNVSASDNDLLIVPQLLATDIQNETLAFFTTPTPGAANAAGSFDFVADVQFSADRGFYDDPFPLTISTATPGAQIYYTTNGDAPTLATGKLYAGPITIDKTTPLRAAAFRSGYVTSTLVSQTYLFVDDVVRQSQSSTLAAGFPSTWTPSTIADYGLDTDVIGNFDASGNSIGGDLFGGQYAGTIKDDLKSIPTLSIVMDIDDLFGTGGIYTNSLGEGAAWERLTSAEWITDDDSLEFQVNAGVRIHGGAFRRHDLSRKHSLRLLFKSEYGPGKLAQPIFGDDPDVAQEFNTIVLRAGANDSFTWNGAQDNAQYLRDEFGRSLQRATGQPSAHGTFVHLYINGVYWGLYNPVERPDNEFGASYFGADPENWDAIHLAETPSGDSVAWDAMLAKAAAAGSSLAAFMELQGKNSDGTRNAAIAPLLNVESYVDYIALNVWGGNWDWPHNNWWAGRDRNPATTTGFEFFNWDFEGTLAGSSQTNLTSTTLDQNFTGPRNAGQVHTSLKTNPEYRLLFADHVHKLFFNDGILSPANLVARYAALAIEIDQAIVAESARWGDMHGPLRTPAQWVAERDSLLNTYLPQRSAIVLQELKNYFLYPNLAAPTFSQHGGLVTPGFDLTVAAAAGAIWYTLDGGDPRAIGGAISPTAIEYTGTPIDIPYGVTVRARALNAGEWSALNEAEFTVPAVPATASNLRITELHYNPAAETGIADTDDLEFIELTNISANTVSLDGVRITQFSNDGYDFAPGLTLSPGQRIVVARSPSIFQATYGAGVNVAAAGYFDANLSNGGEAITLLDPQNNVIQSWSYDDVGAWPAAADGGGKSLEIIDPLASPSDPTNWRASYYRGGSPGTAGLAPPTPADFDGDGLVTGNDFLRWQRGLGTPALHGNQTKGDADGDRDVDAADLAAWRSAADPGEPEAALAAVALRGQLAGQDAGLTAERDFADRVEPSVVAMSTAEFVARDLMGLAPAASAGSRPNDRAASHSSSAPRARVSPLAAATDERRMLRCDWAAPALPNDDDAVSRDDDEADLTLGALDAAFADFQTRPPGQPQALASLTANSSAA